MTSNQAADLCRVAVVTPQGRFDVALPATVPLAYLLPTLLRHAGPELADAGVGHGGWALQRLGGWPFDTGKSAAALGIADGDVLYLRPRRAELPPPVFDDAAEAIGWTLAERTVRWNPAATRLSALLAGAAVLALGALAVATAGPPWLPVALVAGLVAAVLLVGGGIASRALDSAAAGTVFGCAASAYAFVAGLAGFAPAHGSPWAGPQVLAGSSAAVVTLALAMAAVGGGEPVFLGATVVAAVGFGAGIAAQFTTAAGTAAVAICLVFLVGPAVPALSYRLARLPVPFLPATAEDLRRGGTTMPAARLTERSLVADRYVTAPLAGSAIVALAGGAVVARGWVGVALMALVGLGALLRTRLYTGRGQRIWLLVLAVGGTAEAGVGAWRTGHPARLALVLVAVLVALLATSAAVRPERSVTPLTGRLIDVLDIVAAIATVPLVLDILGVYGYVRTIG